MRIEAHPETAGTGVVTVPVQDEVRRWVREAFLYLEPERPLADEDDLLDLGLVDSLGFVELVEHVQEHYGVAVPDADITAANFGSVAAIVAYLARRGVGAG
jgi:acyl carrier protein